MDIKLEKKPCATCDTDYAHLIGGLLFAAFLQFM